MKLFGKKRKGDLIVPTEPSWKSHSEVKKIINENKVLTVSQEELDKLAGQIVKEDIPYDPDDYEEVTELHANE
jgi:hypothetical protein